MGTQVFRVKGMSCEHCVQAVTDEFAKLPGVQRIDVDLGTGAVTVATDHELGETELAAVVEEAGYELVPDRAEQPR